MNWVQSYFVLSQTKEQLGSDHTLHIQLQVHKKLSPLYKVLQADLELSAAGVAAAD